MQASAGLPAAAPLTVTLCTLPFEPKVIIALETGESGWRQARAAGSAAPIAPVTAPCEGFCGTLPAANCGLSAAGMGVCWAVSPVPTLDLIASPSGPLDTGWLGGRSF